MSQQYLNDNNIFRNRALPYSQQVDVTLDPRPLAVQEQELEEAKALTRRKLAHQLEASDLALHKMFSRNIIQLDVFPFTLKAIRLVKTHFAMFDIFNIDDKKSLVSSSDYIICLHLLYNMICIMYKGSGNYDKTVTAEESIKGIL